MFITRFEVRVPSHIYFIDVVRVYKCVCVLKRAWTYTLSLLASSLFGAICM